MVSLQWMNSIVRLSVIVQSMPVLMGLQKDGLWTFYKLSLTGQRHFLNLLMRSPVLKICFGPPIADFWRKFRQIQPTTKVRILCFDCPHKK